MHACVAVYVCARVCVCRISILDKRQQNLKTAGCCRVTYSTTDELFGTADKFLDRLINLYMSKDDGPFWLTEEYLTGREIASSPLLFIIVNWRLAAHEYKLKC